MFYVWCMSTMHVKKHHAVAGHCVASNSKEVGCQAVYSLGKCKKRIHYRGGTGILKVVRPLHIKDDLCMCKEGGGLQQVMCR